MFSRPYIFALIFVLGGGLCADSREAVAHLSAGTISGTVVFMDTSGGIRVSGTVTGLEPGRYGFHIHELGDITTCDTTGAHFNPDGVSHAARENSTRHVGDLGNLEFVEKEDTGMATIDFVDTVISLMGRNSILGRALVLHEQEDDLGLGGQENSLTTGNAGARVACGVIGIKSPADPWNSAFTAGPSITLLLIVSLFYLLKF